MQILISYFGYKIFSANMLALRYITAGLVYCLSGSNCSKVTKPQVCCWGLFLLFESTSISVFPQAAKSGRRARLTADQSSLEESRHVRKASTSTSTGDVCYYAITECWQNVWLFKSIMHMQIYMRFGFVLCESQDDDQVRGVRKSWDCACLLLLLKTYFT